MGEGFCLRGGGSIQRPSGVQWSLWQSFQGWPGQRVVAELAREVGGKRRIPAQAGPIDPPTLCPSDWGAVLSFSQGVGEAAI